MARGETKTKPTILRKDYDFKVNHGGALINLPKESYDLVIEGMIQSVNEGTSKPMKLNNIQVAGKTGTTQVRVSGQEKYLHIAWSLAFAPAENPEIALVVMAEEKEIQGSFGGALIAAPIAKNILKNYFHTN